MELVNIKSIDRLKELSRKKRFDLPLDDNTRNLATEDNNMNQY